MSQGPTKLREYKRAAYWALGALFAMNLLNYIDRNILAAVIDPVQADLGVKDQDALAGLLSTAFFVSYSLISPLMGWMGDRLTRKYLLAAGVGVWSLATFGSGFADSFGHMLLARSLMGIGEATYAVIAPTLIADFFPREHRSRALAVFYVAIPVGSALGYVIGGQVEHFLDWRWAFYMVGLPGLVVAFAALGIREPHRGASEDVDEEHRLQHESLPVSWETYTALAKNRSYVYNTLGLALMTFVLGGMAYWTPLFLSEVRGMARKDANTYLGVVLVFSGLVGTALGGWLGDWLARRIRGAYFWLAGLAMPGSVPFIALALVATEPLAIFSSMAIGLTLVFLNTGPSNAIIINVTMPRIRAAAFAINIFFIHLLGDIPSPPVMGLVSDLTGNIFWGLAVTLPALAISGILYCMGARYLEADQEAMVEHLRTGKV